MKVKEKFKRRYKKKNTNRANLVTDLTIKEFFLLKKELGLKMNWTNE